MDKTVLALIVGLVAGAGGAVAGNVLTEREGAPAVGAGSELAAVEARLERLESSIQAVLQPPAALKGTRARPAGEGLLSGDASTEALLDRIAERVDATIEDSIERRLKELAPQGVAVEEVARNEKKKATLAEAAAELGISAAEEEELRRIYDATINKALTLLAGKDGDAEDVRRDLLEAQNDPERRMAVAGKYMGRVMTNIGEFIVLGQTYDSSVKKLIGNEKKRRLENDFKLTDVDPFDLEGIFEGGFGR